MFRLDSIGFDWIGHWIGHWIGQQNKFYRSERYFISAQPLGPNFISKNKTNFQSNGISLCETFFFKKQIIRKTKSAQQSPVQNIILCETVLFMITNVCGKTK